MDKNRLINHLDRVPIRTDLVDQVAQAFPLDLADQAFHLDLVDQVFLPDLVDLTLHINQKKNALKKQKKLHMKVDQADLETL